MAYKSIYVNRLNGHLDPFLLRGPKGGSNPPIGSIAVDLKVLSVSKGGGYMSASRCLLAVIFAAVHFLAATPNVSFSRTWYINSLGTGDAPTIQAGIDSASAGDIVSLADGTYTGAGNRDVDFGGKAITVQSQNGIPAECIVDVEGSASSLHRGFLFLSAETAGSVLDGVTIRGGYQISGGVVIDHASPTITHCIFTGNTATVGGGAIVVGDGAPSITYCTFEANTAQVGGAVYCNNASPTLQFCEFTGDSAGVSGGAFASEHGSPTLEHCQFSDNWAGENGGAIVCFYDDDITLTDLLLSGNEAGQVGGAMSIEDIVAGEVSDCTLRANTAQAGGAVHIAGNLTISGCTMYENVATQFGGAIIYAGGLLEVGDCTLGANSAPLGAGITCFNDQPVAVTNTIIAFSPQGEAVYCYSGAEINLNCCDVFGNARGDWVGSIAPQGALMANFSADPEFCGELGSGNFELQSDSPCAPGNHPKGAACGVIGARPVGCDQSPVKETSWGEIKSLFENKK
jgi:predicted outer membrane repeat protein